MLDTGRFHGKILVKDKEGGELVTGWSVDNFRGSTYRYRAEAQIDSAADGTWRVKIQVEKERVFPSGDYDVSHPESADWDSEGYDAKMASDFVEDLRSMLGTD